ncbi:MAG TPA: DUF1697 domain-containing protein [Propionibacteriaceae bacterium]|nr:DUF1697 domain-containing protein [Propionibacteriaceae bacterium]
MRYAIFLRGVNVGGVKVPSADLKRVLGDLGLADVKTYVASGNVTCESDLTAARLQEAVEAALSEAFSYDAHVQVLSHEALGEVVEGYPFATDDDHHRYVVFCDSAATAERLGEIEQGEMEEVAAHGRLVYWRCPKGSTLDTPFSKATSGSRFKGLTTTRNLNTVEKML